MQNNFLKKGKEVPSNNKLSQNIKYRKIFNKHINKIRKLDSE